MHSIDETHMISDVPRILRNNALSPRQAVESLFTLRIEPVRHLIGQRRDDANGWFPIWYPIRQGPVVADLQFTQASDVTADVCLTFTPAVCPSVRIGLVAQQQPYGGVRWWFVCPASGRRTGRLYWQPLVGLFVSRAYGKFCHSTQNEGRRDRVLRRVAGSASD